MLLMIPIAIVTISEHIGHQLVLSKVVGRDYIKEPGLHRSILGDGIGYNDFGINRWSTKNNLR